MHVHCHLSETARTLPYRCCSLFNNLGTVYRGLDNFQQAKDNHARALDIRLKQLGPEHVDVAASYNNLGNVYRSLGDFKQAMDNHASALNSCLKINSWDLTM